MNNSRMETFLSRYPIPGIATFFCTERFLSLESADHDRHEIGLHPFLDNASDWMVAVKALRTQWPKSFNISGIRSHSCTFSQRFGVNIFKSGYTYISHMTPPPGTLIPPFRYPWGITEVPIAYMDNMDLAYPKIIPSHVPLNKEFILRAINSDLPYVFDFHPLHILINTSSPEAYAAWWANGCPEDYVCEGSGIGDYFSLLTNTLEKNGAFSHSLSSLLKLAEQT
jgi:hypothetical protein